MQKIARLTCFFLIVSLFPVRAQELDANMWVTDGEVQAIARSGNAIYLGGAFSYAGPNTGGGALLDPAAGKLSPKPLLQVNGTVRTAIPDGAGGWYIGGKFTYAQGVACVSLAHILPDGRVDPTWNLNPYYWHGFWPEEIINRATGDIYALALHKGVLYVGGDFYRIGGVDQKYLAAIDVATRKLKPWRVAIVGGNVEALTVADDTLYIGGEFYSVADESRRGLAAIHIPTARVTPWAPRFSATTHQERALEEVTSMRVMGSTVFVGGYFKYSVGTAYRSNLAAIDVATGQFRDWDLDAPGKVFATGVSGNTLYVAGSFNRIGGQSRNDLAAIDPSTGNLTDWNPQATDPSTLTSITALAISGNTAYLAGVFSTFQGVSRDKVAAVDLATGRVTPWAADLANQATTEYWQIKHTIYTLAAANNEVFMGGIFFSTGGQHRENLAALDAATGRVLPWNPKANGPVRSLQVSGSTVFAGGEFTALGSQNRGRLGAIHAVTGEPTAWNPSITGKAVHALALLNNTVFAGGEFSRAGNQPRANLAALDAGTGAAKPWTGNANGSVNALAVANNTLFAGGAFGRINDEVRKRLAAFDPGSGQLRPWAPAADSVVNALAVGNGRLYVGGQFSAVSGQPRSRLAAVEIATGGVAAWSPAFGKTVTALAFRNNALYATGDSEFSPVEQKNLSNLCRIDVATGGLTVLESFPVGRPLAIAAENDRLYVGGNFRTYRGRAASAFAALGKYTSPPHLVKGSVYQTRDGDCTRSEEEKGMVNRLVVAQPGNYFASTDSAGNYTLAVDSGSYTIRQVILDEEAGLVTQKCPVNPVTHSVRFSDAVPGTVAGKDFANLVVVSPRLSLDVSSDRRRRCFAGQTTITYRNAGNQPATGVKVFLQLPEHVRLVSADLAYQRDQDHHYVFDVGTLAAGETGRILVTDSVVCDKPFIRGLTQCTKAWITPFNPRSPGADWDGSDVQLGGVCTGNGSVRLGLYNRGRGNMADSSSFRVYLDARLAFDKKFKLNPGDSLMLLVPANGQTVRLEADQRPGHPTKPAASLSLEACGTDANGTVSKGFVTRFPQDDPEPEVAVACLPITDSYDPNDKLVAPEGVTAEKFTPTRATLHYTVRFQNTGTDVAYRVVVVDTLSEHLDVSTLHMGTASHAYVLGVTGKGRPVLTWTFNDINLPDSTRDRRGSNGHLQFSIKPKANLPEKTRIENYADIFFDYNEPIRTNVTRNTLYDVPRVVEPSVRLGESIIQNGTPTATEPPWSASVLLYPNPTTGLVAVALPPGLGREVQLSVGDALGRTILHRTLPDAGLAGHREVIDLSAFGKGMYLVTIKTAGGRTIRKVFKN